MWQEGLRNPCQALEMPHAGENAARCKSPGLCVPLNDGRSAVTEEMGTG